MEKQNINKAVTFSFAAAGFLAWWVAGVIFETLADALPLFARMKGFKISGIELYQVGLPFLVGLGLFLYLQFNSKKRLWAEEVVVETSKVVWPSQKDVQVSTVVVSIMLLISGIVLFSMDTVSSFIIDFILGR